jgi:outer membrane protein assembly factor BamD
MKIIFGIFFFNFFFSCKEIKLSIEKKFETAMNFYKKKDYVSAIPLFLEFSKFKGKKESIESKFYLGKSYFEKKNYKKAEIYLSAFFDEFPQNEKSEDVLYMKIKCNEKEFRDLLLDQNERKQCLKDCDMYLSLYKDGYYVLEIKSIRDSIIKTLEKKFLKTVETLFDMKRYKNCIDMINLNFDSIINEEYMYELLKILLECIKLTLKNEKNIEFQEIFLKKLIILEKKVGKESDHCKFLFTNFVKFLNEK